MPCGNKALLTRFQQRRGAVEDTALQWSRPSSAAAANAGRAPLSVSRGGDYFYQQVQEDHVPFILKETILQGKILFPLLRLDHLQSIRSDLIWEKETECLMALDSSLCMVQTAPVPDSIPCRRVLRKMRPLPSGDQTPGRGDRIHDPRPGGGRSP